MARQLLSVEINRAEVAAGVALGLVVEMAVAGMAAFAAGGDRPGADAGAEFDHGDEAVAAGPVPAPGAGIGARGEGGERAPAGGGEGDRDAWAVVVEVLVGDCVVEPLEAVDLAPAHAPAAPVALEPRDGAVERVDLVGAAQALDRRPHIAVRRAAAAGERPELVGPEAGDGGRLGFGGPARVP